MQIDQLKDDFPDIQVQDAKSEPIPSKMDFNTDLNFANQVLSYQRV